MQSYINKKKNLIKQKEFPFDGFFLENFIITFSCVMVKKELLFKTAKTFTYEQAYDWYLWILILLQNNELVYIPQQLTNYRMHNTSLSNNKIDIEFLQELINQYKSKFTSLKEIFYFNFLSFLISHKRVEKLFRPQVRNLKKFLCNNLFNTTSKTIKVTTINI